MRLVLVTPHRFETADAAASNAALAVYSQAIRDVAAAKQAGLVDLFAQLPTTATRLATSSRRMASISRTPATRRPRGSSRRLRAIHPQPTDFAARSETIRNQVVAKNRLFFHRWRPANETYIFLFRKHEQGNNAVEIPQFDPLVEAAEQQVRSLVKGTR